MKGLRLPPVVRCPVVPPHPLDKARRQRLRQQRRYAQPFREASLRPGPPKQHDRSERACAHACAARGDGGGQGGGTRSVPGALVVSPRVERRLKGSAGYCSTSEARTRSSIKCVHSSSLLVGTGQQVRRPQTGHSGPTRMRRSGYCRRRMAPSMAPRHGRHAASAAVPGSEGAQSSQMWRADTSHLSAPLRRSMRSTCGQAGRVAQWQTQSTHRIASDHTQSPPGQQSWAPPRPPWPDTRS